MKELSIEEKAKAYDEALKRAKEYLGDCMLTRQEYIERVFPELIEDENVRIIKEIIQFLRLTHPQFVGRRNHEDWIAWLEKQGEQKDILEDATLDNNEDGLIADTIKSKGEQKPADKVEPKFKVGDIIRHKEQGFTCKIIAVDTEYRLSGCNGNHLPFDWQDAYELVEQKSAEWSEEDETTKNNISHIIRQYDKISKRENQPCYYVGDCLLWMQNIKGRVLPQPKQEWSEEDEKRLDNAITQLKAASNIIVNDEVDDSIAFIKSLKDRVQPQFMWKPSKEQLESLEVAKCLSLNGIVRDNIESILNNLKKL